MVLTVQYYRLSRKPTVWTSNTAGAFKFSCQSPTTLHISANKNSYYDILDTSVSVTVARHVRVAFPTHSGKEFALSATKLIMTPMIGKGGISW